MTTENNSPIKDSGKREDFITGSRRDTRDGKGRFDLIPTSLLTIIARHLEDGSKKYGDRNWEKGQPVSRYMDSAFRHLVKYWGGHVDEMHLHAALWNIMAIIETEERVMDGDLSEALDDHPQKLKAPLLLRVYRHVTFPDNLEECWLWDNQKYGIITVSHNKKGFPHEIVCEEVYGPKPTPDSIAGQTCGNTYCVNPRHLHWISPSPSERAQGSIVKLFPDISKSPLFAEVHDIGKNKILAIGQ